MCSFCIEQANSSIEGKDKFEDVGMFFIGEGGLNEVVVGLEWWNWFWDFVFVNLCWRNITTRNRICSMVMGGLLVGQFKRCTAPAPVLKKDGREKSTSLHGVHKIVYIYYDCVKRCAVTGFIVVWWEVLEDSLVAKNTPPRKRALVGYTRLKAGSPEVSEQCWKKSLSIAYS